MGMLKTPHDRFEPKLEAKAMDFKAEGDAAEELARAENEREDDPRQRGLMVGSLCLLLVALSIVIWHDRDFWFADSPEADDTAAESAPVAKATAKGGLAEGSAKGPLKRAAAAVSAPPEVVKPEPSGPVVSRTVLPPLDVEVVAGDSHRVVRPGNNSVRVDLRPGTPPQAAPEAVSGGENATAAQVTSKAADRVRISTSTSATVSAAVRPDYPLLARQMKVQGAVVLQALIGRDGIIQNLKVLSGPSILASAAEDAVRQWHFKPHYEGGEAVETQARITVNFTISTN
jgi:protein TonB